jgi:phosphohistidine phosphatase
MHLFFLRHGRAYPRSRQWRPDRKRPLTREGEAQMFDVARGLLALGAAFDVILTSPYARALRTAEILAEVYQSQKLFPTARLAPDAPAGAILQEIKENFAVAEKIILVGHEPSLSRLISKLLTGRDNLALELKKAGACKLSVERPSFAQCARLHWLLTPKQLSRTSKKR